MNKNLIDRDVLFEKVTKMYKYAKGEKRIAYRDVLDVILDVESEGVKEKTVNEAKKVINED